MSCLWNLFSTIKCNYNEKNTIEKIPSRRFFCVKTGRQLRKQSLEKLDALLDASDTPSWFNLEGDMIRAKVIDVYDGDTVTLVFQFGDKIWKDKCRLTGINTPEIRTRDPDEKVRGLEARNWLRTKILNKKVWVECGSWDKYGRLLGTIYETSNFTVSVNQELINLGFAIAYSGGTKIKTV